MLAIHTQALTLLDDTLFIDLLFSRIWNIVCCKYCISGLRILIPCSFCVLWNGKRGFLDGWFL